jgi:asparagine synthase (glutamine-hydrolysing)
MCGLAGLVMRDVGCSPSKEALEAACGALRHRGPDGSGTFVAGSVGLAHTRLSIIDVMGGRQPMSNDDDSVVAIFNGEIWNHASLRRELQDRGHRFATRSDTEVLIHGYEEWGRDLVQRLDGMFAFAVWDTHHSRLFVARDRLGKKPLYYAENQAELAFASDVRALNILMKAPPVLEADQVASFLFQRYTPGAATLFRGVSRLKPGHTLTLDREGVKIESYWRPATTLEGPADLTPSQLRDSLTRAVEKRLMSDVPLGIFLSAGLDSAAVLALARECSDRPMSTYTVGFADAAFDERAGARSSAAYFGANSHELVVDKAAFRACLPRLAWYRDEPIAEPAEIPLLLLAEFAAREVKVVLSGEGSDEIFGGYPKYRAERILRLPVPGARHALLFALRRSARRRPDRESSRAAGVLGIGDERLRWASWFRSFAPDEIQSLLRPALRATATPEELQAPLLKLLEPYQELDPGRQMQIGDLLTYLPDNLLLRADKVLMAASLEGRFPMLDVGMVDRALRLPVSERAGFRRSKKVLRSTLVGMMPPEIVSRPKRGFPVPIASLLLSPEEGVASKLLLSDRALDRGIFDESMVRALVSRAASDGCKESLKLYTLISLELWLRANVDEQTVAPPTWTV